MTANPRLCLMLRIVSGFVSDFDKDAVGLAVTAEDGAAKLLDMCVFIMPHSSSLRALQEKSNDFKEAV